MRIRTFIKHPLILMLIALVFVGIGCLGGVTAKLLLRTAGILDTIPGRAIQVSFFIVFTTCCYQFYLKKFEHRPMTEYGTPRWFSKVLIGIAIGSGLILVQVGFLWITGNYHITEFQPDQEVIKYIFLMILIGFIEELIARGIVFRLVEKWAGSIIALLVVAIEGGLTHATNPNATLWSSVAVGLEFGVLMTLVYMATRNLWVVSSLHFAWNFTMGGIFDIAVSGTDAQSLFKATLEGPVWLTGGAFGIEAGTPAILITIISSAILIRYLKNNNGFKPPNWRTNEKNVSRDSIPVIVHDPDHSSMRH
ncbi:MAG: CPBP family intramembrane metalloprotease [Candidatus Sabulitectum sp.]|nr:CPBP family intramembrane metalloprotease [Candidatus Sabulitectum sp.]